MTKTARVNSRKDYILAAIIVSGLAAVLFYPDSASSFTEGLKLWFACVLPSLFPYMFLSAMLSEIPAAGKVSIKLSPVSEKVFKINGYAVYAFFLSVVSGYPIGAKTVSDLRVKGLLSETEAVRAAALCSTSSPVFLIASVGGIAFKSTLFGVALFITHILSAFSVGVLFSFYKKKDKPQKPYFVFTEKPQNALYECAEKSVISVLVVGGLIAFFYLFTDVLFSLGIFTPAVKLLSTVFKDGNVGKGVVFSVFECTKGLKNISLSGINFLTLPLCAAVCGFGGLSVILQSVAFLKTAKIKVAAFLVSKLIAAAINFAFGCVLSVILFV